MRATRTTNAPTLLALTLAAALTATGAVGCKGDAQDDAPPAGAMSYLRPATDADFDRIEDPPIEAETHFAAGQLAESQKNVAVAIRRYEEAIALNPRHDRALYRAGVLYAATWQYPKAVETWKKYLDATGGSAAGYSNLGFAHELAGQPADAAAAYEQGIARDPKHEACRVNYGLMLARQGRVNEATLQLRAVLSEAEVAYNLGSIHEQQGRKDQARTEYRRALQLQPNFKDAEARLGALE